MNFVNYSELVRDVRSWIDTDPVFRMAGGVIGVPRSGMIPATVVATTLNLPLVDLETFLQSGGRFYPNRTGSAHTDSLKLNLLRGTKRILLIDDSIHEGSTLRAAMREIYAHLNLTHYIICPMAVYSSGVCGGFRSYREIEQPRLFEWNWTRHKVIEEAMCDMDGVLCFDPPDGLRGAKFREWASSVEPRYLPTRTLRAIVTSRVATNKEVTEIWLERHRVQYQELRMIQMTEEQRDSVEHGITHKYRIYGESASRLFIESNQTHAQMIHKRTGKPVLYVPASGDFVLYK